MSDPLPFNHAKRALDLLEFTANSIDFILSQGILVVQDILDFDDEREIQEWSCQGHILKPESNRLQRFKVWIQTVLDRNNDILPKNWSSGFTLGLLRKISNNAFTSHITFAKNDDNDNHGQEVDVVPPPVGQIIVPSIHAADAVSTLTSFSKAGSATDPRLPGKWQTMPVLECTSLLSSNLRDGMTHFKLFCRINYKKEHVKSRFAGITVSLGSLFIDAYYQTIDFKESRYEHLLDHEFDVILFPDTKCRQTDGIDSLPSRPVEEALESNHRYVQFNVHNPDQADVGRAEMTTKKKSAFDILLNSAKKAAGGVLPDLYKSPIETIHNKNNSGSEEESTASTALQFPQFLFNKIILMFSNANLSVPFESVNCLHQLTTAVTRILVCFYGRVPSESLPKSLQFTINRMKHSDRNRSDWSQAKLKIHRDLLIQNISACPFPYTQRWSEYHSDLVKLEELLTKQITSMAKHAEQQCLLRSRENDNFEMRLANKRWVQPTKKVHPRYHALAEKVDKLDFYETLIITSTDIDGSPSFYFV